MNQAEFEAYEDWCDELVPDGKGGTQKRFRFNGRLTSQMTCWQQAEKVGAMSRATFWYDGQQVRVSIDKPATPTHIFCDANIFADSYDEESTDQRQIPSAIEIKLRNESADYADQPVRAKDNLGTTDVTVSLDGFGCTSVPQFGRLTNFLFDKFRTMDLTAKWQTDQCGMDVQMNELAYVQHDSNGRGIGGRVVSAAGDTVVLNKSVSMTPGTTYYLILQTLDDVGGKHVVKHTVSSLTNPTTVVLTAALTYVPVLGDVFIFTATPDIFRITSIGWQADITCQFGAEQYKADYYTRDAGAPTYDTTIHLAGPTSRSGWRPVSRQDLIDGYSESRIYESQQTDQVRFGMLTFTGDDVDSVSWAGTDEDSQGVISVRGSVYPIESDATGTTDRYIYWDPDAADPTELQHTNDYASLVGTEVFILGENIAGVWKPWNGERPVLVDTPAIQAGAVVNNQPAFTDALTSLITTETTVQSVTITSAGGNLMVNWSAVLKRMDSTDDTATVRLYRGATEISAAISIQLRADRTEVPASGNYKDAPAAGTYTYYLKVTGNGYGVGAFNRGLCVTEYKR